MAGQIWQTLEDDNYKVSPNLTRVLRNKLQPKTRFINHCDPQDFSDMKLHAGSTFYWDVYGDVDTQGGSISEHERIPETQYSVTQNSGTITEYGNSVPFTYKFDNLSFGPAKQIIHKQLKNDCVKAFEAAAYAKFAQTPLTVTPANGDSATAILLETTGTPTYQNDIAMNNTHVKLIADEMKERNIPVWDDDNYRCLARTKTFRAFKDDLEGITAYVPEGFRSILNGEVGRHYEGVRFFEHTSVANKAWASGTSDEAFFFGEDTVGEAIMIPPEIRGRIPNDYGRDRGIAWYAMEGFALIHSVATDARIVRWANGST